MSVSAFGRGYLRLEILLALFAAAAAAAIWLDRPERAHRSVAGLLSLWGALLAAGAALLVPGAAGHAAQTSPRALSLVFDWLHLVSGSLWVGGLAGLLVLWGTLPTARRTAGLAVCVPRFSNTAFVSVMVLLGSGIGAAVVHLPTLAALWQTSYGTAIIAKAAILLTAMLVASVNLLRTKPALRVAGSSAAAAVLLRRLVGVEVVLVAGAVAAAAVLSSLPPPPKALASLGAVTAHDRPWTGDDRRRARRLPARDPRDAEQGRGAGRLRREAHARRRARTRRDGDRDVRDARHGDAEPVLPAGRARAGAVRALDGGARDGRALGTDVRRRAAGHAAVYGCARGPGERMRRVALSRCLVAGVAAGPRARTAILRATTSSSNGVRSVRGSDGGQAEADLTAVVTAANKAGFKIRVAVIGSAYDLGSVTALWRKPQTYARFLGAELAFVYRQRLLVVMPNGFGFNWPKHSPTAAYAVLSKVRLAPGAAGLLDSATAAVQALAKVG